MREPPSIPFPRGHKRVLHSALLAAEGLYRLALLRVRAGFDNSADPRARLVAELDRAKALLTIRDEELRILRARLSALPPRERPHYPPEERFAILSLRAKTGWNAAETARRFLVTPATIAGWTRRLDEHGESALVKPHAPVNRHSDRTALLVKQLHAAAPHLGRRRIADVLARAGLVLAASTVERLKKRPLPPSSPQAPRSSKGKGKADRPAAAKAPDDEVPAQLVRAKHPHHLWHVDITCISTGGTSLPWWPFAVFLLWPFSWHVAVVLAHFSRSLVAFGVYRKEPTGRQIARLLDRAVTAAGKAPRHIVSDRGSQFQSEYRGWCTRNGARPRFGAIGKHGSIAVIERFIRSLKHEHLRRILVPFQRGRLVTLIASYQRWYNDYRPHSALCGLTPTERLEGRKAPRPTVRYEPRARYPIASKRSRVRRCEKLELIVRHVDGQRHLPIVELREAA